MAASEYHTDNHQTLSFQQLIISLVFNKWFVIDKFIHYAYLEVLVLQLWMSLSFNSVLNLRNPGAFRRCSSITKPKPWILIFLKMPHFPSFTNDEDWVIKLEWGNPLHKSNAQRYEAIQQRIGTLAKFSQSNFPCIRSISSYARRYKRLYHPPPTATTSNKRLLETMTEEALNEYEFETIAAIKNRREEIQTDRAKPPYCPICLEHSGNVVVACCGHVFCVECYCRALGQTVPKSRHRCHVCPVCRSIWNAPGKVTIMPPKSSTYDCKIKGAFIWSACRRISLIAVFIFHSNYYFNRKNNKWKCLIFDVLDNFNCWRCFCEVIIESSRWLSKSNAFA